MNLMIVDDCLPCFKAFTGFFYFVSLFLIEELISEFEAGYLYLESYSLLYC